MRMPEQRTKKKHRDRVVESIDSPILAKSEARAKQLPEDKRIEYAPDEAMLQILKFSKSDLVEREIIKLLNELLKVIREARESELGRFGDGVAEEEVIERDALDAVPDDEYIEDSNHISSTPPRNHPALQLRNLIEDFYQLMDRFTSPFGGGMLRCKFSELDPAEALYMGLKLGQLSRLMALKVREPEIARGHLAIEKNKEVHSARIDRRIKRYVRIKEIAVSLQAKQSYQTADALAKAVKAKLKSDDIKCSIATIKRALKDMR